MIQIREKLVKLKNNNKIAFVIYYFYEKIKFHVQSSRIECQAKKRLKGEIDERFLQIRKYKNKHCNKRCFIIATGPSLEIEDLELLQEEITFSMNSICKIFDRTIWRPTYFAIQDEQVYAHLEETIKRQVKSTVFIGDNLSKNYLIPERYVQFPFNHYYHESEKRVKKYFVKISDDAYTIIYDGYSVVYSILQIAIYMGFKEIYLLGTDCNYIKGEKNHIADSGFVDPNAYDSYERLITGYHKIDEYAKQHGIQIVNCTRGGKLEIFPRMRIEDVLGKTNGGKTC